MQRLVWEINCVNKEKEGFSPWIMEPQMFFCKNCLRKWPVFYSFIYTQPDPRLKSNNMALLWYWRCTTSKLALLLLEKYNSWLTITRTLHTNIYYNIRKVKLFHRSLQGKTCRNSYPITRTLVASSIFCFLSYRLVPLQS